MADRPVLVQVKKYIDNLDSGIISYRKAWMWDFTCPTFWKLSKFSDN